MSDLGEFRLMVASQIDELTAATGLVWSHDDTGGGHDALFAYFDHPADYGMEYPRLAYVMLTCDASVVEIGSDTYATLGFYPDSRAYTDWQDMGELGDEGGDILTLDRLVGFVGKCLSDWKII